MAADTMRQVKGDQVGGSGLAEFDGPVIVLKDFDAKAGGQWFTGVTDRGDSTGPVAHAALSRQTNRQGHSGRFGGLGQGLTRVRHDADYQQAARSHHVASPARNPLEMTNQTPLSHPPHSTFVALRLCSCKLR